MSALERMPEALYKGDAALVSTLTRQALDNNVPANTIVTDGLLKGMDLVGVDFRDGTLFIPEVLCAASAMKAGMSILRPLLVGSASVQPVGRVVMGTVNGDLHDIGKNLVALMLEGAGFEVHDLGIDVPPDKFTEAVKRLKPDLLGMSALLTTTMAGMRVVIDAIGEAGLRSRVKIMIGGAPVTHKYADQIGADAYAPDAATAVVTARLLMSARG